MNEEIKDNLFDLYNSYKQHKLLFKFWEKFKKLKNEDEIRERLEYLKKHNIKQRTEVETLLWILNELENGKADN